LRQGLLAEPARSPGGHRRYPAETVTVPRVTKAAQRLGFALDEVANQLAACTAAGAMVLRVAPAEAVVP
jgi:DNA-binding transcriptional MerR regulator